MKKTLIFLIILNLVSCKNYLATIAVKYAGVYEDKENLHTVNYNEKKIVFIPMHHLGTKSFYNDVKNKIDSLKNENYYFIYELPSANNINETIVRKFRKIVKNPLSKEASYTKQFKALYPNIKYEKPLIDQPSYEELGLTVENSERADADYRDVVDYYEKKYGEITLTDCDYKTSIYENYTKCKEENKVPLKQHNDVLVNFRNDIVVKNIKESPHQKIAVIYGEEHMKGIFEKLKK